MLADSSHWGDLDSCPPSRGGWSLPGPLWADLRDMLDDALPGVPQIVGHSPVERVENYASGWMTAGRDPLWACDTMSLMSYGAPIGDGSMLLVDEPGAMDGSTGSCGSCGSGAPGELCGLGASNGADDVAETLEARAVPFPGEGTFAEACKRYWEAH